MASAVAVDVHNEAEWLTELITSADRNDKSADLVSAYAESELKRRVDEAVEGYLVTDKTDVPHHIQQELQTASETVTPWWWGFKTLVKYRTPRNYQARLVQHTLALVPLSKDRMWTESVAMRRRTPSSLAPASATRSSSRR